MKTWFAIETSLIDRDDLTTYEKLCGIVMARYAGRPEFNHLITVETLAKKMAISVEDTHKALSGLFDKGLITEEISTSMDLKFDNNSKSMIEDLSSVEEDILPRNLIKLKEQQRSDFQMDTVKPMQMPSWDNEDDAENMLMQVMEFIEEPINARQGRIILGLANNNIEKVKSCYNASRTMFGNARIDALIECLQIKDIESDKDDIGIDIRGRIGGQVNRFRLEQMKKYNKFSKKTKK